MTGGISDYVDGQGCFPSPAIIGDARQDMTFVKEEIFGPFLAVATFNTEEQAIELVNDTIYGLGSSVWTGSPSRAHRVSSKIEAGLVWVNDWGGGDATMPFGAVGARIILFDRKIANQYRSDDLGKV